jgi:hypothetical protein
MKKLTSIQTNETKTLNGSNRQHAGDIEIAGGKIDRETAERLIQEIRQRRETINARPPEKRALTASERKQWQEDNKIFEAAWSILNAEDEANALKRPELMTKKERRRELKEIADKINGMEEKIRSSQRKAAKLLWDAVYHAKGIGDLLARAKQLLRHGKYEQWIEDNFIGGKSTARAYKQIAEFENWRRIQARGRPSIREALALLKEKEEPPASFPANSLVGQFERLISEWPEYLCEMLTDDAEAMDVIEKACKQRYAELHREQRERDQKERELLVKAHQPRDADSVGSESVEAA